MNVKLQRIPVPVVAGLLALLAVLAGGALGAHGRFEHRDNLLFEADCRRVIENSTSLSGPQERARIHPLHVLLAAPLGRVLGMVFGSLELATVVITALCAAFVLVNLDRCLTRQLGLALTDRLLFVLLLGASASHFTFGLVPDTHIMSALGLSGMASALDPERVALLRREARGYVEWLRLGGWVSMAWSILAVGMLGTSIVVVPVLVFVQLPSAMSIWRRLWIGGLGAASVLGVVLGLHLAQRAVWPPVPSAQATAASQSQLQNPVTPPGETRPGPAPAVEPSPPSARAEPPPARATGALGRLGSYVRETWLHNSRWITSPSKLPERVAQVANATFVTTFFAPRFEVYVRSWSSTAALSFEPWALRHRLPGIAGMLAGTLLAVWVLRATRGRERFAAATPLAIFCAAVVVFYALVVGMYGDELFLYSPNWAFAVVLLAAIPYSVARASGADVRLLRGGLGFVVACLIVNSALHTHDLLRHFL